MNKGAAIRSRLKKPKVVLGKKNEGSSGKFKRRQTSNQRNETP